jgi:hypothetical protein
MLDASSGAEAEVGNAPLSNSDVCGSAGTIETPGAVRARGVDVAMLTGDKASKVRELQPQRKRIQHRRPAPSTICTETARRNVLSNRHPFSGGDRVIGDRASGSPRLIAAHCRGLATSSNGASADIGEGMVGLCHIVKKHVTNLPAHQAHVPTPRR